MQIDALVRNVTLSGVFVVGLMICALIVCLLIVVLSLTFRCWWTLGDFYCVTSQRVDQQRLERARIVEDEEELVDDLSGWTEDGDAEERYDYRVSESPPPRPSTAAATCRAPLWLLRVERNGRLHTVKMAAPGERRHHQYRGGMV